MKFLRNLVLAIMLLIPLAAVAAPAAGSTPANTLAFHDAMRKLWEDHVTWTRLFIVSDVQNLPDLGPTTDRLLQNQVDIGNAIKPYYGDQAGAQLTDLLTQHILIAKAIVDALKVNDRPPCSSSSMRGTRTHRRSRRC